MQIKSITMTFQKVIPRICLQITGVSTLSSAWKGGPLKTESRGSSVARAKAANVSMIKLTHNNYTAEIGDSANIGEQIAIVSKTERLTVI